MPSFRAVSSSSRRHLDEDKGQPPLSTSMSQTSIAQDSAAGTIQKHWKAHKRSNSKTDWEKRNALHRAQSRCSDSAELFETAMRWAKLGDEALDAELNTEGHHDKLVTWLKGGGEDDVEKTYWQKVADSNAMTIIVMATVTVNGIQMGFQTDWRSETLDTVYWFCDNLFTFIFAAEMCIKLKAYGRVYFGNNWNRFDFLLTCVSITDTWIMAALGGSQGMKMLSVLRILRVFRAVRLLRMVRNFRELTLIIMGFAEATRTTVWVCLLLVLILYIFSIYFTNACGRPGTYEAYDENGISDAADFNSFQYFGTIPRSMFTLLNLVMLTDDWSIVSRAILEQQPFILCVLIVFVIATTMGLLNVIIGIIAECVSSHATNMNHDADSLRRKELLNHLEKLCEFVFSIDLDGDHTVDSWELQEAWEKSEMQDILGAVRLPLGSEAHELLTLLDTDGNNKLEMDEFVKNFVRLLTNDMNQQLFEIKIQVNRVVRELKVFKEEWDNYRTDDQNRHRNLVQRLSRQASVPELQSVAEVATFLPKSNICKASVLQPEPEQEKESTDADLKGMMLTWDLSTQLNRLESATAKQSKHIMQLSEELEVVRNQLSKQKPTPDPATLAATVTQTVISALSPKLDALQSQMASMGLQSNQPGVAAVCTKCGGQEALGGHAIQAVAAIRESLHQYDTRADRASLKALPADEVPKEWRESLPQRRESAVTCAGWEADCWEVDAPGERPPPSQPSRSCGNYQGPCVRRVVDSREVKQSHENVNANTVQRYNPNYGIQSP